MEQADHVCTKQLETVQRGGSNVYFPLVSSSIYIPPSRGGASPEVQAIIDNSLYWNIISASLIDGDINRQVITTIATQAHVDPDQLHTAAKARLTGSTQTQVRVATDEEYRRQEFDVLVRGLNDPRSDLYCETLEGSCYSWLSSLVSKVGLVRKLRETRVLVGFSRIQPKSDRNDAGVQSLSLTQVPWLPAVDVRGEGIFIEFDNERLAEWAREPNIDRRIRALVDAYNRKRMGRGLGRRHIDARFMFIHTMAHVLIKELTFTCGYGSASLRERIYWSSEDPNRPMNGVLIYTASGDAEGTLGGLVNQATPGRLERLFSDALRRSQWCSNDPVCMESPGHGIDTSNLAACHACVLLPETSCEEGNRLLDRGLIIGTIDDDRLGFCSGPAAT
jgi:hypothetical protein